ncbi:MAG: precorrin-3B C(17)-methyltransferase [Tepidanaerobacteraceae bacterium]|jgi:precorrin-3B C17-methyltransferase|nr:precorrin-3B C(17)-methyltransferase [Tepidanaerobacteraceae bacterium]
MGWIKVVGIGPGQHKDMTVRAIKALRDSEVVIGYATYINLIRHLVMDKEIIYSGMRQEVDRCKKALELAFLGRKVALVSGGDPGIYGMAGILYELAQNGDINAEIEIIPGVSAVNAAASLLGAPLMTDFASISLSDHLTPWEAIAKRLEMAARADFVIALFNPKSSERRDNISRALDIVLKYRCISTPCGIVKNAYRKGESTIVTKLGDLLKQNIDMTTLIIIGNSSTFIAGGKMITPRGYVF